MGCILYKLKDFYTAEEKLRYCIEVKTTVKTSATVLLRHIWASHIGSCWWRWWLFSPFQKKLKRVFFTLSVLLALGIVITHPFINKWLKPYEINTSIMLAIIFIIVLILLSPILKRIKFHEIELELSPPPSFDFSDSLSTLGPRLSALETEQCVYDRSIWK